MRLQRVRSTGHGAWTAQCGELRHLQAMVPTRVDPLERLEIEIHVHGQAVVARMTADADAHAAELLAGYVNTGCFLASFSSDAVFGSELNHALFQSSHDVTDT